MALRVTKAVTRRGRYYAVGDIIDNPTGEQASLGRLFKWETVSESLDKKRKPELVQIAEARGLDSSGLTKPELIELLTE